MLMNHADTQTDRVMRGIDGHFLSADENLAAVRLVQTVSLFSFRF
jgi:hypothetical protein